MESPDLRVWGVGTPRTMRPHWALAELGLDYETREILPRSPAMESPEFLRISRRRKVPILECGDLVIGESGAIVFHLAERHRDRLELAPTAGSDARGGRGEQRDGHHDPAEAPLHHEEVGAP